MRILCTVLLVAVFMTMAGGIAMAFDGAPEQDTHVKTGPEIWVPILGAGLSLAIAAGLGALGQAKAIAASVESIARQPEAGGRIFVSMIIGLALIETLVIYTLVIAFMMLG